MGTFWRRERWSVEKCMKQGISRGVNSHLQSRLDRSSRPRCFHDNQTEGYEVEGIMSFCLYIEANAASPFPTRTPILQLSQRQYSFHFIIHRNISFTLLFKGGE